MHRFLHGVLQFQSSRPHFSAFRMIEISCQFAVAIKIQPISTIEFHGRQNTIDRTAVHVFAFFTHSAFFVFPPFYHSRSAGVVFANKHGSYTADAAFHYFMPSDIHTLLYAVINQITPPSRHLDLM